jgi:hypothetical protein
MAKTKKSSKKSKKSVKKTVKKAASKAVKKTVKKTKTKARRKAKKSPTIGARISGAYQAVVDSVKGTGILRDKMEKPGTSESE